MSEIMQILITILLCLFDIAIILLICVLGGNAIYMALDRRKKKKDE